jgi:glutamate---cysteine ligase / carboxylate-amine ligase
MAQGASDQSPFLHAVGRNRSAVAELRATFDLANAYTVGIEDELMLLDPDTLELVPRAQQLLRVLGDDPRFKLELPASQLELVTPASIDVGAVAQALLESRRKLASAADGIARLASAGVHPFSSGIGELNRLPRYRATIDEYGPLASRQLVCALQVHVAVGDADRALAVYNAARSYLPLLAALAANAPFYEGRDTGLASVRPKLAELLPRQGVPPEIESWESYVETLAWGGRGGIVAKAANVVVGAASAPGLRHARVPGSRRPEQRLGCECDRSGGPGTGRLAGRASRHRRALAGRP